MFYMDLSHVFTLPVYRKDDLSHGNELSNNNKNYLIRRKEQGWGGEGMINLPVTHIETEPLGMSWPRQNLYHTTS